MRSRSSDVAILMFKMFCNTKFNKIRAVNIFSWYFVCFTQNYYKFITDLLNNTVNYLLDSTQ